MKLLVHSWSPSGSSPSIPNIHFYDDTKKEAFWILWLSSEEFGNDRLTSSQIAEILVEKLEISRTPQAIGSALGKAASDGLVDKNKKTGEFKLMKKGREEIYHTSFDNPGVIYIEPGKPFTGKHILVKDILSKTKNRIWIFDPYIGPRLLDLLRELDPSIQIRIMTKTVQDKAQFTRSFADFRKEHPDAEVKTASGRDMHDRYILSDSCMWLVGHSLKDLGSKESFIVELGEDIRDSMDLVYDSRWKNCSDLQK